MNERTQKTSCVYVVINIYGNRHDYIKNLTYGRVKHWANGIDVCPKKEQLSNLLHDLFKNELAITYKCRL